MVLQTLCVLEFGKALRAVVVLDSACPSLRQSVVGHQRMRRVVLDRALVAEIVNTARLQVASVSLLGHEDHVALGAGKVVCLAMLPESLVIEEIDTTRFTLEVQGARLPMTLEFSLRREGLVALATVHMSIMHVVA